MLMKALASEPLPIATTLNRPNSTITKYSGDENCSANFASGSVSATMTTAESRPPPSAANQRPAQRLGRPALAPHGVAVPQHGHVDRLARNAKQNGGEGAAIGAGDIHRGQQDDRSGDVHFVGEGQRQRHAHHQRQARQYADQQADDDADEQHRHVDRREAVDEAAGELGDDIDHDHPDSGIAKKISVTRRTARCRAAATRRRCAGTGCRTESSPRRWCPRSRRGRGNAPTYMNAARNRNVPRMKPRIGTSTA